MSGGAVVAMSGGVDSSVAAALAQEAGLDITGVTLRLWSCDDTSTESTCCNAEAVALARAVAADLGFAHEVLDVYERFDREVLEPCWRQYASGRTPNPCALCNPRIKFGSLVDRADALGAHHVATGHLARVLHTDRGSELRRGADPGKDQSYFLFGLEPEQLSRALFPVGELSKHEVRDHARRLGLPNAERAESQDACFGGGGEVFAEALRHRFAGEAIPGPVVDRQGQELGRHDGIHQFTVGQRRGLGVSLGRPAWVVAIRPADHAVVVSTDPGDLLAPGLLARACRWHGPTDERFVATVQVRYRHAAARATVIRRGADAEVRFDAPQRAITPGQAAVFYDGDRVIGGGWIEEAR